MAPASSVPAFIGAVKDEYELFSDKSSDYTIGAPIGFGASSIVYAAEYSSHPGKCVPCALKVLDLDALPPHSLALLQRETTLMSLSKHPNVLRVRGSWLDNHKLFIALRLMNRGSAADIMRYGWPGGMEEDVIRCILEQALQGLNYLHVNGFIHRDVKAANLLVDDDGTVLLGDLGVAADLTEDTSKSPSSHKRPGIVSAEAAVRFQHSGSSAHSAKRISFEAQTTGTRPKVGKRKSFVGTPCWMAPEVIEARHYDSSADIWSFGITALELAQGRPPRSRESPQKVLLKIIQEAPPTLDREGGTHKYSRSFKELVDSCLVKDPVKRPTAHELLQSPFFKSTKKKSYLVNAILKDLPPLTHRQERRIIRGGSLHGTIDSWDFGATTINSPHSARNTWLDQSESRQGEVFELEDEKHPKRRSHPGEPASVPEEQDSEAEPEIYPSPDIARRVSPIIAPPNEVNVVPLSKTNPMPMPKPKMSESLGSSLSSSATSSSLSHSPSSGLSSSLSSSRSSNGIWKKIKGAAGLRSSQIKDATIVVRGK
ncbi:STE/STE20/FRAY protein kinase [Mycena indigotica]|uniref:STE/STE20/FRAY protein kinase n=1 Tax=Mycena indigotica TaxID=2126181 RepID=A0A8H6SWF7_9AGAR|nr:STE/STE20/FRAY protein kinase [Mycena indigotica]KAF7306619.1 STE/STE20/FRAY protein kinase [Mycena indigotica]